MRGNVFLIKLICKKCLIEIFVNERASLLCRNTLASSVVAASVTNLRHLTSRYPGFTHFHCTVYLILQLDAAYFVKVRRNRAFSNFCSFPIAFLILVASPPTCAILHGLLYLHGSTSLVCLSAGCLLCSRCLYSHFYPDHPRDSHTYGNIAHQVRIHHSIDHYRFVY